MHVRVCVWLLLLDRILDIYVASPLTQSVGRKRDRIGILVGI